MIEKIYFVTKNKHKLEEARLVLKNIIVEQIPEDKVEDKESSIKEIAKKNAFLFYKKYKKPIIVDDTGVFFKAYKNFPGSNPKLIFNLIDYKGIFKLLENENREAYFITLLCYKDEKNFKIFEGKLNGVIDYKVNDITKDVLPYERIFLVNGKPFSSFSREEKNKISHRAIAFRKLYRWLMNNENLN